MNCSFFFCSFFFWLILFFCFLFLFPWFFRNIYLLHLLISFAIIICRPLRFTVKFDFDFPLAKMAHPHELFNVYQSQHVRISNTELQCELKRLDFSPQVDYGSRRVPCNISNKKKKKDLKLESYLLKGALVKYLR